MEDTQTVNYALALKIYQQKGLGRSMKKFCEEEGYDYAKFMRYARRGQRELQDVQACGRGLLDAPP